MDLPGGHEGVDLVEEDHRGLSAAGHLEQSLETTCALVVER